jgi:hypothetical protein
VVNELNRAWLNKHTDQENQFRKHTIQGFLGHGVESGFFFLSARRNHWRILIMGVAS